MVPATLSNPTHPLVLDPWALLDKLPGGLAVLDSHGVVRYHNGSWQPLGQHPLTHFSPGEVPANPLPVGSAEYEALNVGIHNVLKGMETHFSLDYPDANNQQRWWNVAVLPFAVEGNLGALVQTQQVLMPAPLRALQKHATHLTQFLDGLPIGVFALNAAGRPYYTNQSALNILGTGIAPDAPTEQLADVYNAYVSGTDELYPAERMPVVKALSGIQSRIDDMEIVRPEGRAALEVVATPVYGGDGSVEYAVAAFIDITARKQAEAVMREGELRFRAILDSLPVILYTIDLNGVFTLSEGKGLSVLGLQPGQVVGLSLFELYRDFPDVIVATRRAIEGEQVSYTAQVGEIVFETMCSPLRDQDGEIIGAICIGVDVTERLQAEEIIRAQAATVRELSTPLIPISDRVVVMPMVGSIDSQRAQQVMETLLQGITERQARVAIIDITGVSVVDTQVANALIRAAQAVKLLGAQVLITGIRPEVAQTLVGLGVELGGIVTRSTLQSGIAWAMGMRL